MNLLKQMIWTVALATLSGCASYDWFWHKSPHATRGKVTLRNGERADVYIKCVTRFLSNSSCDQAFGGSSFGEKLPLSEINAVVWEALKSSPQFKSWPTRTTQRPFLEPASVRVAPFRIVLVAIDPVVVLLLPTPSNDNEFTFNEKNFLLHCRSIHSACGVLSLEIEKPIIYDGPLLHGKGMYWLAPEENDSSLRAIPDNFETYPLPGTNVVLSISGESIVLTRK